MRPLRRRPIRACVIPMVQKNVDAENLTVRQGADAPEGVAFHGEAVVVVHQAFGPTGESLVGVGDVEYRYYHYCDCHLYYGHDYCSYH